MSKERLKEIKNCYKDDLEIAEHAGVCLTKDDYLYLINQAERVYELEQQNKRYREALELLVKQETLGKDAETGKTAVSYNGMIALKGLNAFDVDNHIIYGADEVIESVLEESE